MPKQKIIKQILELIETMEQGLTYIQKKLGELKIEGTITVLTDTINAFLAVEKSISKISEQLPENQITEKADKLKKAFDIMVSDYEETNGQKSNEIMQFTLNPAFKNWEEELEKVLKPYVLS